MDDRLIRFQKIIGYRFNDIKLLEKALTHTSYANEKKSDRSFNNERLEFLGDAVLEILVSEYLYFNYRDLTEGQLTKFRAKIVCEPTLARLAKQIELGKYIYLGKGEMLTGGNERASILSDAFEAIIGAVFLDGGFDKAKGLVNRVVLEHLKRVGVKNLFRDYKTELQEVIQSESSTPIVYKIVKEEGPAHNKCFVAGVSHEGKLIGTGQGRNKKEAEQNAAKDALEKKNRG